LKKAALFTFLFYFLFTMPAIKHPVIRRGECHPFAEGN
jgi:hypothetical protein